MVDQPVAGLHFPALVDENTYRTPLEPRAADGARGDGVMVGVMGAQTFVPMLSCCALAAEPSVSTPPTDTMPASGMKAAALVHRAGSSDAVDDAQAPARHVWPAAQTVAQAPQCCAFSRRLKQLAPHAVKPVLQAHAPEVHVEFPGQTVLQAPQFVGEVCKSKQVEPHRFRPAGHPQTEPLQVCVAGQAKPQKPQFDAFVVRSVHVPLQVSAGDAQAQAPLTHESAPEQPPQFTVRMTPQESARVA